MKSLATIALASVAALGPVFLAFGVIHLRAIVRRRRRQERRPFGPLGTRVHDLKL